MESMAKCRQGEWLFVVRSLAAGSFLDERSDGVRTVIGLTAGTAPTTSTRGTSAPFIDVGSPSGKA